MVCWSPLFLSSLVGLVPSVETLPPWSLHLVMSLALLYPVLSPFIFAFRNQKIR